MGWRCRLAERRLEGALPGYRAPYEPPADAERELHVETTRPGELVGIDC